MASACVRRIDASQGTRRIAGRRPHRSARVEALAVREAARLAGARREDPHLLERAHDQGARHRGARAPAARPGRCRRRRPSISSATRCGATAACWPPTRTAARTCRPISMTTPFWPTPCSSCCRPAGAAATWNSRRRSPRCCWIAFEDPEAGGFFFTAADHEQLIHRSKTFSDESIPSGNGVAAGVLCRLGFLLGEPRYLEAAERTLQAGLAVHARIPAGHMSLIAALEDFLKPLQILILRGPRGARAGQHALASPLRAVAHGVRNSSRRARVARGHRGEAPGRCGRRAIFAPARPARRPFTRLADLEHALDGTDRDSREV